MPNLTRGWCRATSPPPTLPPQVDALPPHSIAAEFNAIVRAGCVEADVEDATIVVPTKAKGCFDLAAIRGIRGGRGRCACHCSCQTASDRHSVPACLDVKDTSEVEWSELKSDLDAHKLLDNTTMRDDSHTPPKDWDYVASPWRCPREGCECEFVSHEHYLVQKAILFVLRKCNTEASKKERTSRATKHLKLHPSNQEEFKPPLTLLDMIDILLDPLHAGLLNIPKTIWKYSFGDRMTNEQRELVAEYLESIGCPLDVRAKGDGRDANRKWFLGCVLQEFVEGTDKGNNPGLMKNITAILDIIYVKCPDLKLAPAPPPPQGSPRCHQSRPTGQQNRQVRRRWCEDPQRRLHATAHRRLRPRRRPRRRRHPHPRGLKPIAK